MYHAEGDRPHIYEQVELQADRLVAELNVQKSDQQLACARLQEGVDELCGLMDVKLARKLGELR